MPADVVHSFYNIEEYGAVDNGDITDILNTAFQFGNHRTTVYIPGKLYKIHDTVTIPERYGGSVYGAGYGAVTAAQLNGVPAEAHFKNVGNARILWIGDKNKPMIKIYGKYIVFDGGLTLIGRSSSVPVESQASIGILVTKQAGGEGAGKMAFNALTLRNLDVCFQCGSTPPAQFGGVHEGNNDNLVFNYFHAAGTCGIVYKVQQTQSMVHTFNYLIDESNLNVGGGTTFHFIAGGLLQVKSGLAFTNKFLVIPSQNDSSGNNGTFNIQNLKVDAQSAGLFKGLVMETPVAYTFAVIRFENLHIVGTAAPDMFQVNSRSWLTFRNCMQAPLASSIRANKHTPVALGLTRPNILIDNCYCDPAPMNPASTGYTLSMRDCFTGQGGGYALNRIPDAKTEKG